METYLLDGAAVFSNLRTLTFMSTAFSQWWQQEYGFSPFWQVEKKNSDFLAGHKREKMVFSLLSKIKNAIIGLL